MKGLDNLSRYARTFSICNLIYSFLDEQCFCDADFDIPVYSDIYKNDSSKYVTISRGKDRREELIIYKRHDDNPIAFTPSCVNDIFEKINGNIYCVSFRSYDKLNTPDNNYHITFFNHKGQDRDGQVYECYIKEKDGIMYDILANEFGITTIRDISARKLQKSIVDEHVKHFCFNK